MTGRQAMLIAFDRLFDRATRKLDIACDDGARDEAREQFVERFSLALKAADELKLEAVPEEVMVNMEEALDGLTPAQIAGHLASVPIAHQAQQMLQALAFRAAEQRMLRHIIDQADDTYGGN